MRPKPPVFETRRAILLCINAPQTHQSAAGHMFLVAEALPFTPFLTIHLTTKYNTVNNITAAPSLCRFYPDERQEHCNFG